MIPRLWIFVRSIRDVIVCYCDELANAAVMANTLRQRTPPLTISNTDSNSLLVSLQTPYEVGFFPPLQNIGEYCRGHVHWFTNAPMLLLGTIRVDLLFV